MHRWVFLEVVGKCYGKGIGRRAKLSLVWFIIYSRNRISKGMGGAEAQNSLNN